MFFGPLFPDARGAVHLVPPVQATLALGNPTTAFDGPLEHASIRALAAGVGGDAITVQFSDDSLGSGGDLVEDFGAKTVHVKFSPGDTTVQQIHDVIASGSALVELIGTWNPLATLSSDDDEFGPTHLAVGADARSARSTFWGPLFADRSSASADPTLVAGVGPIGAAQFVLSMESGTATALEWITDVFKSYSGKERRASVLSSPRQSYKGAAFLVGDQVLSARGALEKFAALGSIFLLGLPGEELTLVADASGKTVHVADAITGADWLLPGQRVAVLAADGTSVVAVIQSTDSGGVVRLDSAPGDAGAVGGSIMPLVPVILDAQQGFARFPVPAGEAQGTVERWEISARGAAFPYRSGATPAKFPLDDTLHLSLASVCAVVPGSAGNGIQFQLVGDSGGGTVLDDSPGLVVVHFEPGSSTAGNVADALLASVAVRFVGTWTPSAVLTSGDQGVFDLEGGADEAQAPVGRGAALTTYRGRPVFDRGLDVDTSLDDSAQAMSAALDLGGAPASVGSASQPDWGRKVRCSRSDPAERQWLRLFLWTVRGRWGSFWLPTGREDLRAVADPDGDGTIVVATAPGDFAAWYAGGHRDVVVDQEAGSTMLRIDSYVDNGDGTTTLSTSTDPADGDAVPVAGPVDRISWLELCRLESDQAGIRENAVGFAFEELARAVQR